MKKHLLLLVLLVSFVKANAQTFATGHMSMSFTDASRSNRSIPAEIYYPADVAGESVPLATAGGNFPVVVFGHGFVMVWSAYDNIWNALAQNGFIAVFPTTESGFSPNHTEFGKDLAYLVTAMQNEGANAASPFYGRVDYTSAVMGHSMGGGSSFLAMQYNPNITAIVNLAAAETNPSAIAAAASINKHALVIAGANDCITPPATNQLAMYNALGSNCKVFVSITGASHCQFASTNVNCSFGELTCSPQPAISRATQHSIVNQLIIPWLKFELENDCTAGLQFEMLVTSPVGFTAQKNCYFCTVSSANEQSQWQQLTIYPTLSDADLFIKSATNTPQAIITICGMEGKTLSRFSMALSSGQEQLVDIRSLPAGNYTLQISNGENTPVVRKFTKVD